MKKKYLLLLFIFLVKSNVYAQDIDINYGSPSSSQTYFPGNTVYLNLSVCNNGPGILLANKVRPVITLSSERSTISFFTGIAGWDRMTDFTVVSLPDSGTAILENAKPIEHGNCSRARVYIKLKKSGYAPIRLYLSWIDTPSASNNLLNDTLKSELFVRERPTPVSLASFEVKGAENLAELHWSTAQERNNAFFEIQHSTDGISFESIGQVTGKGNSTQRENYHYTHAIANPNIIHYYRLKQVDFDGKFEYSSIRSIQLEKYEGIEVKASTLTNRNVKVSINYADEQLPDGAKVSVCNQLGKVLQTKQIELKKGENNLEFQTYSLTAGIYIIRLENQVKTKAIKVVLP